MDEEPEIDDFNDDPFNKNKNTIQVLELKFLKTVELKESLLKELDDLPIMDDEQFNQINTYICEYA